MTSSSSCKQILTVPILSESIHEVRIAKLLIPSFTKVKVDQEIAEIETDKLSQTLYSPFEGSIIWEVSEGDIVTANARIGLVESNALLQPQDHQSSIQQKTVFELSLEPEEETVSMSIQNINTRETILSDVVAQSSTNEKKNEYTKKPMSMVRRVIAERLREVKETTAMLTTFNEIDMQQILEIRKMYSQEFFERFQVKLGLMSFFVKAASHALKHFPIVNSYIDGTDIIEPHSIDIGVAVSTEKGVIVPVIRNADTLTFAEIEKEIEDMAQRARSGKIALDDLQGGTFTITNGGVFGSLLSTPILNPPQSAILGMHAIQKRAHVVNDQIVIRPMMYVALSYDHRLLDGQDAILFLMAIKNELEDSHRQLLGL